MTLETPSTVEEDLDPSDWDKTTQLGKTMVHEMMDYLKEIKTKKIWKPIPEDVKEKFKRPLPQQPQSQQEIYEEFKEFILPYNMGNVHPRFWGWVIGTGTPYGALGDFLSSIMNPNLGGGEHSANYVEKQVLDWCKEMLDYPKSSSGILLSGGSMANFVGLAVARNTKIPGVTETGLFKAGKQYTIYCSKETHSSVDKAAQLLGLGYQNLRKIPVDENFEIIIDELESLIARDKHAGLVPIAIVGNAGTVNTGAIDNLAALADICKRENLWFHIDGAFGALAYLSNELKTSLSGISRSDSLAFDLHKWMYMNYELGVTLVRDKQSHYNSFSLTPDYLSHSDRGVHSGEDWFSDYGLQLSRGFRALKAWMSFKEHGIGKYGELIQQNIDQTRYLAQRVESTDNLELMAPVKMNIVCLRFNPGDRDRLALNELNQEILIQLHERGVAVPSYTIINNNYVIRMANTNHRSRLSDFDILTDSILEIGQELVTSQN